MQCPLCTKSEMSFQKKIFYKNCSESYGKAAVEQSFIRKITSKDIISYQLKWIIQ